ncbi:MAG: hypothetical protein DRI39_05925 [Chloroflexi bacterium]|nr:MAG: hypothetical protein DRI39_05925 [Chloroflexota bacterium]
MNPQVALRMRRVFGLVEMVKHRRAVVRVCSGVLVLCLLLAFVPVPVSGQEDNRVSVSLAGWGWCLSYGEIADVTLDLEGKMVPRADAATVSDLHLTGTLWFSITGRDERFDLDLYGTKVRSLFFLKQVTGGPDPTIAAFEGAWLEETNYVACEGRIAVRPDGEPGIKVAKPYLFVLGTPGVEVPERQPGGWAESIDFIVQKGVQCLDVLGTRLWYGGDTIKDLLGKVLAQITVLYKEIRDRGAPYFP